MVEQAWGWYVRANVLGAAAAAICLAASAGPAMAQDADAAYGLQVWKTQAPCHECHGWAGDGDHDIPQQPSGANFRKTTLTQDQLVEVIRCGRPGSEMPYFGGNNAWSTARPCYGMTKAQAGDQVPVKGDVNLNDRQINSLALYIFAAMVGKPGPTKAECEAYFAAGALKCTGYPDAAK